MKLTDTQLKLLSAASQRDDRVAVIPGGPTGAGLRKVVDRLLANELIEEFTASASLPSWRTDDDGTKYSLRITHLGLKAIGVVPEAAEFAEAPKLVDAEASTAGRVPTARRTAGRKKIAPTAAPRARLSRQPATSETAPPQLGAPKQSTPRAGSKLAAVIALLQGRGGATIPSIMAATGWLPHSTRAALTGLRKRGYALERQSDQDGQSVYRIAQSSEADPKGPEKKARTGARKAQGSRL